MLVTVVAAVGAAAAVLCVCCVVASTVLRRLTGAQLSSCLVNAAASVCACTVSSGAKCTLLCQMQASTEV
jgi:hypothetical protein